MDEQKIIELMNSVADETMVPPFHNDFWTITQDELVRFTALVCQECKNSHSETDAPIPIFHKVIHQHGKSVTPYLVRIVELEFENRARQARIDELMLEYCPDEMTPEQLAKWQKNQRAVSKTEEVSIENAIKQGDSNDKRN